MSEEEKKPKITAKRWNEKFTTYPGEMKKVEPGDHEQEHERDHDKDDGDGKSDR